MNSKVTIVMYHYVRDLEFSRYPEIKGLSIDQFKGQLDYLEQNYTIITMENLIEAVQGTMVLPDNAALLTFDDGYQEHFSVVFPILMNRGLQGSFFPPVETVVEKKVLDVNRIHFILASVKSIQCLIERISDFVSENTVEYNLETFDKYYETFAHSNGLDTPDVIFVKRMLQVALPETLRSILTEQLFNEFVGVEEEVFSRELYLSLDQIKCMKKAGMFFGSHGNNHYWLSSLTKDEQEREINKSLAFLKSINVDIDNWVMCFPYGNYDNETLGVLKTTNCTIGLTTKVGVADIIEEQCLELSRVDTVQLPFSI